MQSLNSNNTINNIKNNVTQKLDEQQNSLIYHLTEISEIFLSTHDLYELANKISDYLTKIIKYDGFYIALISEKYIKYIISIDNGKSYDLSKEEIINEDILNIIVNKTAKVKNFTEQEFKEKVENNLKKNFGDRDKLSKSYMIAPIIYNDNTIGIISTHSYNFNAYNSLELNILSIVANQLAITIKNKELIDDVLKKDKLKSILEMLRALAHKLNQPLTGIACYNSIIMAELNKNDKFYEELHEIDVQALRMEELIKRIQKVISME